MSEAETTEETPALDGKEHKVFIKSLKKKFEDTQFASGESMTLPKGNSTGSLSLDINLSVPIYEGGIIEIYSNEGGGKTTLALSILAQGAARGKKVLFLDQEQSLQPTLVNSFPSLREEGVLELITAPTGDDALEIARLWANQYPGSIIVIDSVDALLPDATKDNKIGDAEVGNLPKLMSQACRRLKAAVGQSRSTIIFLNQFREKIGTYGDSRTTSGGKALRFYSDQRIELMDITSKTRIMSKDGKDQIGHIVRFKVIKNKVAPPFVQGEFPLIYGKGIDQQTELVTLASDLGILPMDKKYILVDNAKGEQVKKHPGQVADMMKIDPAFFEEVLGELRAMFPETFSV